MQRETLIRYGRSVVTKDTAKALDRVVEATADLGFKIDISAPEEDPFPTHLSMLRAGRQVRFEPVFEEEVVDVRKLGLLWSVVIPLSFVPHDRDPLPSPFQTVFYYYGPWQVLYERLIAEGRGDVAKLSVVAAAQADVGKWEGARPLERFVQAQLHRIGRNPGPVDGYVGPRTAAAVQEAGLKGMTMEQIAEALKDYDTGVPRRLKRVHGHVVIPGRDVSVEAHGGVKTLTTPHGVGLVIDGPGRVVLDIGGEDG